MKRLLLLPIFLFLFLLLTAHTCRAQGFCFYDPNTGPLFHNGSVGAIYDVTAGDFNEDGHIDIVTANSVGNSISFIPGLGNGWLGAPDTFPVGGALFCITSGDFNNDGNFDVAAATGGNIFTLFGNGNGTFQSYVTYTGGYNPSRIYYTDVSGDGIGDLVEACGNGVAILLGYANGNFAAAITHQTGGEVYDVTTGLFNNDTIADIVSTTRLGWTSAELSYLEGTGNGNFAADVSIPVPHYSIFGITSTDIDSNGTLDLLVTNHNNMVHRLEVYTGNGNGSFNAPVFYPLFYNPNYIYLADGDNDGLNDVFTPEGSGFSVLKGVGGGSFSPFEYFVATPSPNCIALADFNEDGWLDVSSPSGYQGSPYIGMRVNCIALDINETYVNEYSLFPNPFHTTATLQLPLSTVNCQLSIYNVLGEEVLTQKITSQSIVINRQGLMNGIYFVVVRDSENEWRGKIIIE